jgi:hypothetical protein
MVQPKSKIVIAGIRLREEYHHSNWGRPDRRGGLGSWLHPSPSRGPSEWFSRMETDHRNPFSFLKHDPDPSGG